MAITAEHQTNILGIVVGLFNAAPGQQLLTDFSSAVNAGLTETQLADILATHPVFTDQIMNNQNTTTNQVAVLMNHYGLTSDGVNGSAASLAETFFTNSIDSGVGFGAIVKQATDFLLSGPATAGGSVPFVFLETAFLLRHKINTAEIYSATNPSTDLATLQAPVAKLITYTGTDATDTYTGTDNGDIISGGWGGDKIILEGAQAARDVLVLKTEADSLIRDTNNDGVITILEDLGFDNVENFKVGTASTDDRLDLSNFGIPNFDVRLELVNASALVPSFETDLTFIPDLFNDPVGDDRIFAFSEIPLPPEVGGGSQTFLFIDSTQDGDFSAEKDLMLELQGTGPLTEAIFIV